MNEKQDKNEYEQKQELKHINRINHRNQDKTISLARDEAGYGKSKESLHWYTELELVEST